MNEGQRISLLDKKKIFIQRDYSTGLTIRYSTDFPEDLIRRIDENAWKDIIQELNSKFVGFDGVTAGTICETVLGCLTCYFIRCCVKPIYEKRMDDIATFIGELNSDVLVPRGIHMSNPIERGFRVLEITLIHEKHEHSDAPNEPSIANILQPRL